MSMVVNCFHFSVSLGYNTTGFGNKNTTFTLWIAFIFQYLWDTTQLLVIFSIVSMCCELLSFFSIFGIQHNGIKVWDTEWDVVNCFHFSVSLGYNTTIKQLSLWIHLLWIAFIFQYLWDTTQHQRQYPPLWVRCELLSFFSIFGIQHNDLQLMQVYFSVVNCFHFSVSLGYNTTIPTNTIMTSALWIAFIFQYLWDTTQH